MIEAAGFDHGEHGSKNLFLLQFRFRWNVREDGRLDEVTLAGSALAASEEAPVLLALLDVFEDRLHRAFVDDRAHGGVFGDVADLYFFYAGLQLFQKFVVDALVDNCTRTGGALLSLEAKCRLCDA